MRTPLLLLASIVTAAQAAAPASLPAKLKPFIETHCIDRHDADLHKGGLRLDNLSGNLDDEKTAAAWTRVFDRVVAGEMPPAK